MTASSIPDPQKKTGNPSVETAKTEPPTVSPSASDADLIAAARSGDASAYGVLYERHASAARALARQIVKTSADVDDVVAETFARVLYALKGGNGPVEAFRPYLLTAVRRVAIDLVNGQRRQIPTDDTDIPDPGEPFDDPAVADLERSLIRRAFWSLPERWRAVLWHTEIEEARPAELTSLLGLSANGVSVLKRRAREGLKQSYLQLHLSKRAKASCTSTAAKLGRYVRGGLSRRQAREVEDHLAGCPDCTTACAELATVNDSLRGVLAPIVLGTAAADYLASASEAHSPAATSAAAGGGRSAAAHISRWHPPGLRGLRLPAHRAAEAFSHHPIASVATAVAAASIAVPTLYLVQPTRAHQAVTPVLGQTHRPGGPGAARHAPGTRRAKGGAPPAVAVASPAPTTIGGASPKPTKSPSRSGHPTPSSSPSTPTSASPTSSPPPPSPTPTPTPTVSATAKLSVSVQVAGVLSLGVTALVTVNVSNPGSAATGPVTTDISLPSGITLLGLASSSSWSCSATSGGQTCSHGAIGAGVASSLSFNIAVVNLSGCGESVVATAVSGSLSATGASPTTVQCA